MIDEALVAHQVEEERRLTEIELELINISKAVSELKDEVKDLVTVWKAASWIVSLVKGLGAIAIAITAIYTFIKGIK